MNMNVIVENGLLEGVKLSESEALLDLALGMYVDRRVTLERAARIAGMSQPCFLKELGKRDIPVNYELDDFRADLKTIASISR